MQVANEQMLWVEHPNSSRYDNPERPNESLPGLSWNAIGLAYPSIAPTTHPYLSKECMRTKLGIFGTDAPVAMVTGSGAPRVGRAIADALVENGYKVVFHANRSLDSAKSHVDRLHQQGRDVGLVTGAVDNEQTVASWLDEVLARYSRIDVVVNSAAVWSPISLESASAADFVDAFRANTLGSALISKAFGLQMVAQPTGGAIVNLGDWAVTRPYRQFAPYFVSKGSLAAMTQTMAIELALRNPKVRVNAILPGPVLLAEGVSEERTERIIRQSLLKRAGSVEDVASAVIFLAESPYITGVCLPVDGGRSIYAGPASDPAAHPDYDPEEE